MARSKVTIATTALVSGKMPVDEIAALCNPASAPVLAVAPADALPVCLAPLPLAVIYTVPLVPVPGTNVSKLVAVTLPAPFSISISSTVA